MAYESKTAAAFLARAKGTDCSEAEIALFEQFLAQVESWTHASQDSGLRWFGTLREKQHNCGALFVTTSGNPTTIVTLRILEQQKKKGGKDMLQLSFDWDGIAAILGSAVEQDIRRKVGNQLCPKAANDDKGHGGVDLQLLLEDPDRLHAAKSIVSELEELIARPVLHG